MKKLFFLLIVVVSFACNRSSEIPKDILPKATVTKVLIEMHIAESAVAVRNIRPDSALALYKAKQHIIFKKLNVDSVVYNKSIKYYNGHVNDLDQIYAAVVDSLSLREGTGKID